MRITTASFLLFTLLLIGCGAPPEETTGGSEENLAPPAPQYDAPDEDDQSLDGQVGITPDNTRIEFVGTHAPGKTEPRQGEFRKFKGHAVLEDEQLQSIHVDIDTTSVSTEAGDKLTNHLKSADFFDVNEHPQASFQSTEIVSKEEGKAQVTGDLTLLGNTKSITFPVEYSLDEGLVLTADFIIDRTEFGMDYGQENVEKEVQLLIRVGK